MKAAKDAYSKLSLERAKHSNIGQPGPNAKPGPTRAIASNNGNNVLKRNAPPSRTFKTMSSSLDMACSIAVARSSGSSQPSLLPMGTNAFENNASVTDQQKVRESLKNVAHMEKMPKKPLRSLNSNEEAALMPLDSSCSLMSLFDGLTPPPKLVGLQPVSSKAGLSNTELQASQALLNSSRGRSRFIEAISEQRESGSDEYLLIEESNRPSTSVPEQATVSGTVPIPQSMLNKKAKSPVFRRPLSPKATLQGPTGTPTLRRRSLRSATSAVVPDFLLAFRNKGGSGDQQSDFVKSYAMLFNMKDEEWETVEPIMLTELIEHLQKKKGKILIGSPYGAFFFVRDSTCKEKKTNLAVMVVNVAFEDAEYVRVRNMCDSSNGWKEVYHKKMITVYTQPVPASSFQMIKAVAKFPDVTSNVAYDVLHDSVYRDHWDRHMTAQCYIGMINQNSDIEYYAVSGIPPVRARDFVMQRSWLDTGHEKLICSHSVCHQDYPPVKGYIRGTALLTAYLVRPYDKKGCQITYISHLDPKGKLPTWLVNRLTRVIAPKIVKRLHKACIAYPDWKRHNQPNLKPWIYAEQQVDLPRVDLAKCQPHEYDQEVTDESTAPLKLTDNEDED